MRLCTEARTMKALIPLLLVSTSALAVTTVQFAHRASAERKRADEISAVSQQHEARIHELEKERGDLDRQLMEVQRPSSGDETSPPSDALVARSLQRVGPPPGEIPVATARAEFVASARPAFNIRPWSSGQQSPAVQRYWHWQRKASLHRQYEGVGSVLGLSQAQENKLFEVLADEQINTMNPNSTFKQPPDRATVAQMMNDAKKRRDAEIAAVIGEGKLSQLQDYERTMPERLRVSMVGDQLRQMDVPLTDDQRGRLVDIMIEQSQLNPRPTPQEGTPGEEVIKASLKWEEESDKAFLERAKSVLTPDQYERYRDYQAWQSEMRANSIRYMQANGQNGGMVSFMRSPISADPPK
jgi:hypothetical protein